MAPSLTSVISGEGLIGRSTHLVVLFAVIIYLASSVGKADAAQEEQGQEFASMDKAVADKYGMTLKQWNQLKKKYDVDRNGRLSQAETEELIETLEKKAGRGKTPWDLKKTLTYISIPIFLYVLYTWWKNGRAQGGNRGYTPGGGFTLGSGPSPGQGGGPSPPPSRLLSQANRNNSSKNMKEDQTPTGEKKTTGDDVRQRKASGRKKSDLNSTKAKEEGDVAKGEQKKSQLNTVSKDQERNSDKDEDKGKTTGEESQQTGEAKKTKTSKRKETPPPAPPETETEQTARILSAAFTMNVEIVEDTNKSKDTWNAMTLRIKNSDVPTSEKMLPFKTKLLFERRLAREVYGSSKIKFCVACYENCSDALRIDSEKKALTKLITSMLKQMKGYSVEIIIENLIGEQANIDDDDLFSGIDDNAQALIQSGLVNFLDRLSGWAEDGIGVSPELLSAILSKAQSTEQGCKAIVYVVRVGGQSLLQSTETEHSGAGKSRKHQPTQRFDELEQAHGRTLRGLEILLNQPAMVDLIAKVLLKEIEEASSGLGVYFEEESVFGTLLKISTVPPSFGEIQKLDHPNNLPWLTIPRFPTVAVEDLFRLENSIQSGFRRIRSLVFKVLKLLVKKHRETTLAWLSALISMNDSRTTATTTNPLDPAPIKDSCGDGFMLNLCSILLDLCLPFCQGDKEKLLKVDPSYCTSKACRLNYHFETCLASGQIVLDEEASMKFGPLPEELQNQFNFMTEIFHLTLRGMNVGFFAALQSFTHIQRIIVQNLKSAEDTSPEAESIKKMHAVLSWRWDCCLVEEEFLRKGTQFYITLARWILLQLETCKDESDRVRERQERKVLSQLPEFLVKDMGRWFWFVSDHGLKLRREALAGLELTPFVDCCVMLLRRPDLVPGPIPAYRITQALNSFVRSSDKDRSTRAAGWGGMISSPLASIVHTTPAVTTDLGPALLHTYTSVAIVEGLDVDKEDFDKYAARADIGDLIENLWQRVDFKGSIVKLSGTPPFQDFLGAILDTLLYQMHDSWSRLANVKKLQDSKEDEVAWNALSMKERREKEKFLASEERTANGFMRMARKTLGLLDTITVSENVAQSFTNMPLAERAASAFLGFLEKLCGSKAIELKVKDMDKYTFNPKLLLSQILEIMLRIVREESSKEVGFVQCLSTDADYNETYLAKALSVLQSKGVGGETLQEELADLIGIISALRSTQQTVVPSDGSEQDWQREADTLVCDDSQLVPMYIQAMEAHRYDTAELLEYHSYQSNADSQQVDPGSQKAKSLMKEMKQWSKALPIHPHAAIFLRQDEERMDVVRALVTGPVDTPYSLGCYAFDIYFPANYPNIPPLVKLITTGNGTVRFNPNLYADGKVCLSLLGTWHGGDASQKWQANKSSLYQVLVSIQSMILITDPMYNEPGYDGMRGTEQGESRSRQYNADIRLWTVRHAMLGQLQRPPAGFEEVVEAHFLLQKDVVLKQCSVWLRECADRDEEKKLRRVVDELRGALQKLCDNED